MAINLSGLSIGGGEGTSSSSAHIKTIPVVDLPSPAEAKRNAIYLVPSSDKSSENKYSEYIVVMNENGEPSWELFGNGVTIDLSDYERRLKSLEYGKQNMLLHYVEKSNKLTWTTYVANTLQLDTMCFENGALYINDKELKHLPSVNDNGNEFVVNIANPDRSVSAILNLSPGAITIASYDNTNNDNSVDIFIGEGLMTINGEKVATEKDVKNDIEVASTHPGSIAPDSASIVVREANRMGAGTGTVYNSQAPRIGFNWKDRWWGQMLFTQNTFKFVRGKDDTQWANLQAGVVQGTAVKTTGGADLDAVKEKTDALDNILNAVKEKHFGQTEWTWDEDDFIFEGEYRNIVSVYQYGNPENTCDVVNTRVENGKTYIQVSGLHGSPGDWTIVYRESLAEKVDEVKQKTEQISREYESTYGVYAKEKAGMLILKALQKVGELTLGDAKKITEKIPCDIVAVAKELYDININVDALVEEMEVTGVPSESYDVLKRDSCTLYKGSELANKEYIDEKTTINARLLLKDDDDEVGKKLYLVANQGDILPGDSLRFARFVRTNDRNLQAGKSARRRKKGWVEPYIGIGESRSRLTFYLSDGVLQKNGEMMYEIRLKDCYVPGYGLAEFTLIQHFESLRDEMDEVTLKKEGYPSLQNRPLGIAVVRNGKMITDYLTFRIIYDKVHAVYVLALKA